MSSSHNGRLTDGSTRRQKSFNMETSENNVPSALAATARAPPEVGHYKPFAANSVSTRRDSSSSEISNTTLTARLQQQNNGQQQQRHPRPLSQEDDDGTPPSTFWTPYQPLESVTNTTTPVVGNRAKARQAKESASANNSFPKTTVVDDTQHLPPSMKSGRSSSSPDLSIDEPAVNLPTTRNHHHHHLKKGSAMPGGGVGGSSGGGDVCFRSTMKGSTQAETISRVVYPTTPTTSIPLAATAPTGVFVHNNSSTYHTNSSGHDRTHGSTEDGGGSSATTTTNEISTTSAASKNDARLLFVSQRGNNTAAAINNNNTTSLSTPLSKPMPTVNGGHRTLGGGLVGSRPPSSSAGMGTSGYQAALASFSSLPIKSPDTSMGFHDPTNNNAARRPTTGPAGGEGLHLPDLKLDGSVSQQGSASTQQGVLGGVRSPNKDQASSSVSQQYHSPGSTLNNSQKAPTARSSSTIIEAAAAASPADTTTTTPAKTSPASSVVAPTTPSEPSPTIIERVLDAVGMVAGMMGTVGGALEGVSSGIWENVAPAFSEASYVSAISTVCFLATTIVLLWVHSMSLVMQAETQSVVQLSHAYHMEEMENFVEEGVMVSREIAEWNRYCSDIAERQQHTTTSATTTTTTTNAIVSPTTLNGSQGEPVASSKKSSTPSPTTTSPTTPSNHSCGVVLSALRDEQHRLVHALVNALRNPLGTDSLDSTDHFQQESSTSTLLSSKNGHNGNNNDNIGHRGSLLVHGGVDTNSLSKSEMSRLNQYLSDSMSTFIISLGKGIDGVLQVGRDSIKDPMFPVDDEENGIPSISDMKVVRGGGGSNSNQNHQSISGSEIEDWAVSFWGAPSLLGALPSTTLVTPADVVLNVLPECAFVDELFRHTLRGCISNETIASHSARSGSNRKRGGILSYILPASLLGSNARLSGSSTPSKLQALLDAPLGGSKSGGGRSTTEMAEEEGTDTCPRDISGVVGLQDYTACLTSIDTFTSLSPFEKRITVSMAFDSITTTTSSSSSDSGGVARTDPLSQRRKKTRNYPHRVGMKPTQLSSPMTGNGGNSQSSKGGAGGGVVEADPTVKVLLEMFNDAATEYEGYDNLVSLVQEYSYNVSKPPTPKPSQQRPTSTTSPKSATIKRKAQHAQPSASSPPPRGKQTTTAQHHQDTDTAVPVTVQFILPDQTNWAGPLSLLCSLVVIWYLYTS